MRGGFCNLPSMFGKTCLAQLGLSFFVAFFTLVVILDKSRGAEPLFAWNDLNTTVNRRLGVFALPPSRVILLFFMPSILLYCLFPAEHCSFIILFDQLVGDINVLVTSHDSPGHTHPVVHYCTAFRTLLQYLTKFDSAAPIQDRLFMTGEINFCARAFVCVCVYPRSDLFFPSRLYGSKTDLISLVLLHQFTIRPGPCRDVFRTEQTRVESWNARAREASCPNRRPASPKALMIRRGEERARSSRQPIPGFKTHDS